MSLKRLQNQTRISDFFSKRFKSEIGDELKMNSEGTEVTAENEDNICEESDSTPCSSSLNKTADDKRTCAVLPSTSEDDLKESNNEDIQNAEPNIFPSSPTLKLSEDMSEYSETEPCNSSQEMDLDTVPSTSKIWRGLPRDQLRRLKPDDLDINSFQEHLHLSDPRTPSTKYDASRDVRMPFYVSGLQGQKSRWEVIKSSLAECCDVKMSKELVKIIRSYNQTFQLKLDFSGFDRYLMCLSPDERVAALDTLKKMADLAIEVEHLCQTPIPILCRQKDQAITMSQRLIASLLANAFFCTFSGRSELLPSINFMGLFASGRVKRFGQIKDRADAALGKLRCIFHYFNRVTTSMPDGNVTFHRQVLKDSDVPNWSESATHLTELFISSEGSIEDEEGLLQVDFANKRVGGGALGMGCVQEEIRFMISPELIISRLFTEVLQPNECIIVTGCETFSTYKGYADTFEWGGDYVDQTPKDAFGRKLTQVVMIDAKCLPNKSLQFTEHLIRRELNKAYCGFSCAKGQNGVKLPAVSTGNWGCGAFRGDVHLKFLIQLLAAAVAGRDVCYYTFNNVELVNDLYEMYSLLKRQSVTVGQLYKMLKSYERHMSRSLSVQSLRDYIKSHFHSGSFASSPEQTDDDDDD